MCRWPPWSSFCFQLCSSRKKVIFPQKALNSQNQWMWEWHHHIIIIIINITIILSSSYYKSYCHHHTINHNHHHFRNHSAGHSGLWWTLATSPSPWRWTSARWASAWHHCCHQNRRHHRALALEEVMRTTLARVSTAGARAMTLEAHPAGQKSNKKS